MGAEGAEGAVSPLDAALESAMATQSSSGRLATHLDNMQRCQTPTIVAPTPAQAHSMLRTAYGMVQTITTMESIEVMRVVVPLLGRFAQREQMRWAVAWEGGRRSMGAQPYTAIPPSMTRDATHPTDEVWESLFAEFRAINPSDVHPPDHMIPVIYEAMDQNANVENVQQEIVVEHERSEGTLPPAPAPSTPAGRNGAGRERGWEESGRAREGGAGGPINTRVAAR